MNYWAKQARIYAVFWLYAVPAAVVWLALSPVRVALQRHVV